MDAAVRFTLSFTATQHRRVKALADRLGITIAEATRRLIDEALEVRANAEGR